ncbi:hypothetical protein GSI_08881 [Ganoderma sinense ZZ0214-1]|uniref:Uncharacterized protein n=1 Tax=Ganoderma sinense ZZ0214-1 TaxID=1077348 RepID=A0A2G8S4Y2_9APHY|nr:hypothetical protein GSI_08881 [Ganoderma sinense ZZ0214-1]
MLGPRPVVLSKAATIPKFHAFIFSDVAARMPYLVALVIDVAEGEAYLDLESSERAIECLVAILRRALCLKSLKLLSSAGRQPFGYPDNPRLSAAIGEVASLRELTIDGQTRVVDFVDAVRSPLTRLTLCMSGPSGGPDPWTQNTLSDALIRFKDSLESLSIRGSRVQLERSSIGFPVSTLTQFHAVRSLTLNQLVTFPHLPILLELFPNLNGTVHLTGFPYYSIPDFACDEPQRYTFFREVREENGRAQERQRWTRLERLICDVDTLFILNLRCPVGLTIVHKCTACTNPALRRYLAESLRGHRSTRLNLQLAIWWGVDQPLLDSIIPPEAAARLTHLTLCVRYVYDNSPDPTPGPRYADTRWDDLWRNALLPTIAPLRLRALTHFRLVFHCQAQEGEEAARPISEEPTVEDLRPTPHGRFDFTAIASVVADALPSLRYCFMTNSAHVLTHVDARLTVVEGWRESRAWQVACDPAGSTGAAAAADTCAIPRELLEMDNSVAEALMGREDLFLSTEEKASTVKHDFSFVCVCSNTVYVNLQDAMEWDD